MEPVSLSYLVATLALALTFGGMTFFSAVMAPLVFAKLPLKVAGPFMRQVFPWYYLTMGAAVLIALTALMLGAGSSALWEAALAALVLTGFVFSRQVLMPRINQARDAEILGEFGAGRRFRRLHLVSVVINALQWVAVLTVLIRILL
ncbi:MAG: DUF4149 domain-containing protein [Gammaproteobacteria bacterium]